MGQVSGEAPAGRQWDASGGCKDERHLKRVMCQLAVRAEDKKGLTVPMMMRTLAVAAVLPFTAALATIDPGFSRGVRLLSGSSEWKSAPELGR
jgi:hypothetical protein